MTAVVGILNTSAVAIAADSAVTVTGPTGQKIYNTGNKIFQLSKKHPVGIAIYGSGSLMITPWEVIIKSYRKELGNKNFRTIIEYRDNFLEFLKNNNYFTTGIGTSLFLNSTIENLLRDLAIRIQQTITQLFPDTSPTTSFTTKQIQQIRDASKKIVDDNISILSLKEDSFGGFATLSRDEFLIEINQALAKVNNFSSIDEIVAEHPLTKSGLLEPDLGEKLKTCLHLYFSKDDFAYSSYTGLVFVGYGEDEIYPQSNCIEVAEVADSRLRWRQHSEVAISEAVRADIIPFAQTDVIQTLLNGLAPKFETELYDIMKNLMRQFTNDVAKLVGPSNPALAKQLQSLNVDPMISTFSQSLGAIKSHFFVEPTVDAVTLFSKEDLAEMAESLVYLTYLQKRMTLDPETVSKPVDVAIISKNDGFVWIKRKYYFEQALNPHFLRNYFE